MALSTLAPALLVVLAVSLIASVTFPNRRGVYRAPHFMPMYLIVKWLVLTNNIRQDFYAFVWGIRVALRYARRRRFGLR